MISRQWQCLVKREEQSSYVKFVMQRVFPTLTEIPGFVDAAIHRRDVDEGIEFQVVTRWESLHAIRQFAGEDIKTAIVPEQAREMMIDYDRSVRHYEVLE